MEKPPHRRPEFLAFLYQRAKDRADLEMLRALQDYRDESRQIKYRKL